MSQGSEQSDENMSKVLETLNLHRLLPVTMSELKNSVHSLTDSLIRGYPDTTAMSESQVVPAAPANDALMDSSTMDATEVSSIHI